MKSVKSLVSGAIAALTLTFVAAPAHACIGDHCPAFSGGIDAQQNAGFGPFGVSAGPFSLSLPGSSGHVGPWNWGLNAQQNAGFDWSGTPLGFGLQGANQNIGFIGRTYFPMLGMNQVQNVGFPGTSFVPDSWGINELHFPMQSALGLNAVAPVGFGGQPAPAYQPYPVMVPYPVQMQQSQGSGVQPVQCSINQVPALTKSVDDCEKAGGEVPGFTKTSAGGSAQAAR